MRKIILMSAMFLPLLASCAGDLIGEQGGGARNPGSRVTVKMFAITAQGQGDDIGTLMLMDSRGGLRIEPALGSLPPGAHGFHLHENANCGAGMKDGKMQAGIAAGGHLDPRATGKHAGPMGNGHQGDLPALKVNTEGNAFEMMHALHLSVNDLRGRAFVIHEGGDNFSDQPKPLGGGGVRIACGVVPAEK